MFTYEAPPTLAPPSNFHELAHDQFTMRINLYKLNFRAARGGLTTRLLQMIAGIIILYSNYVSCHDYLIKRDLNILHGFNDWSSKELSGQRSGMEVLLEHVHKQLGEVWFCTSCRVQVIQWNQFMNLIVLIVTNLLNQATDVC